MTGDLAWKATGQAGDIMKQVSVFCWIKAAHVFKDRGWRQVPLDLTSPQDVSAKGIAFHLEVRPTKVKFQSGITSAPLRLARMLQLGNTSE